MKKIFILLTLILGLQTVSARDWKSESGYRGNVETGFVIGCGDWGKTQWILQTTHGYQVIPTYLFVGGGVGGGVFTGNDHGLKYSAQLFGDVRAHLPLKSKFSPFVDVKAGFEWNRNSDDHLNWIDIQDGFYFSPSVGVNYELTKILSLDLSIGYTLNTAPVTTRVAGIPENREFHDIGGFTVRIGLNF